MVNGFNCFFKSIPSQIFSSGLNMLLPSSAKVCENATFKRLVQNSTQVCQFFLHQTIFKFERRSCVGYNPGVHPHETVSSVVNNMKFKSLSVITLSQSVSCSTKSTFLILSLRCAVKFWFSMLLFYEFDLSYKRMEKIAFLQTIYLLY